MRIEDYEKAGLPRYDRLAKVAENIVQHALLQFDGLANVPQTQSRAKDPASLRQKLIDRGLQDSTAIEDQIKDLAGCRIIFYTTTDLDRFRQSNVWRSNFEIDYRASTTHFPRAEDASVDELYQGIHYVVRLNADRTKLVEYSDLAGLRCEIQLQTILNHAWSETSHDVLYKARRITGFGSRQHEAIRSRLARVMRDHLMVAGYEMQKIQEDAERLRAGEAVFDGAPLQRLCEARDNNERLDLLHNILEHLLPGLDDLSVHLRDIRSGVRAATEAARTVPVVARTGFLGGLRGATPHDVLKSGLEVLDALRYGDVEEGLACLIALWEGPQDEQDRTAIEASLQRLAAYTIPIWEKLGAGVQVALTQELAELGADRRRTIRPLVLVVCRAALGTEMNHSERTSYNAVSWRKAGVVGHDTLIIARENAVRLALEALESSTSSMEWRSAWNCLWSGATGAGRQTGDERVRCSKLELIIELCGITSKNKERIPYDVLQEIEENLYWAHRHLGEPAQTGPDTAAAGAEERKKARAALVACRDQLNLDERYVKYKTLVGFRTVFVEEWEREVSIEDKERQRNERIDRYVSTVSADTRDDWLRMVVLCAKTESDDLATFPPLTRFFKSVSERQPAIALDLLLAGGKPLEGFAPSFLPELVKSTERHATIAAMQDWLPSGRSASSLGRALFVCEEAFKNLIAATGAATVAAKDINGCLEIVHAALKHGSVANGLWTTVLVPAVAVLTQAGNGAIASSFLIHGEVEVKLEGLPEPAAKALLDNFVCCPNIGYSEQRRLARLYNRYPELVWAMFEARLRLGGSKSLEDRYEAVPRHWHGLEKTLGADVVAVYNRIRRWPETDNGISIYSKAELVAELFSECSQGFVDGVAWVIREEGVQAVLFACEVLGHFEGNERIDPICQAMVEVTPEGDDRIDRIRSVIEATGVTIGEFGRAEAVEEKVARLRGWLNHNSEKVRGFAEELIRDLDRVIVEERRRGTERRERSKRDFDESD